MELVLFGTFHTDHEGVFRLLTDKVDALLRPVGVVGCDELVYQTTHCTLGVDMITEALKEPEVFVKSLT